MAHITHEETRVYWLPAVADMAAPTVAEITAGDDLSTYVPVSGINEDITENEVTTPLLGDSFIVSDPGTWSAKNNVTFMRHNAVGDDEAWVLLQPNLIGYLLVTLSGAAIATARATVYHARTGRRRPMASAENEHKKFEVTMHSQEAPELDAVVAV